MTIKAQTEAVMNHPSFKEAIEQYNLGDDKPLRHLFSEIMIHLWQKTALTASRVYGMNKKLDTCIVQRQIRETPPPENLDIRFPIPTKKGIIIIKVHED